MKRPFENCPNILFVGNLASTCNEHHIAEIFRSIGLKIVDSKLIRGRQYSQSLNYGFAKMTTAEDACIACTLLDSKIFYGRPIKVSISNPNSKGRNKCSITDCAIHIRFLALSENCVVTEEFLRNVFSTFGVITDVWIKKSPPNLCRDNGYGFVHYSEGPVGVAAAFRAVQAFPKVCVINNVEFFCEPSRNLMKQLKSGHRKPDACHANHAGDSTAESFGSTCSTISSTFEPVCEFHSTSHRNGSYISDNSNQSNHCRYLVQSYLSSSVSSSSSSLTSPTAYLSFAGYKQRFSLRAGCSYILTDKAGNILRKEAFIINQYFVSSIQPEYEALNKGLYQALQLGIKHINVRGNSELLHLQFNNLPASRYFQPSFRCMNHLCDKARELALKFSEINVCCCSPTDNAESVRMAEEALLTL